MHKQSNDWLKNGAKVPGRPVLDWVIIGTGAGCSLVFLPSRWMLHKYNNPIEMTM
ncbi:hypothetical protein K1F36_18585 [Muricauda sp. W52]|uniref:Uncharacterized protein n=1 Tax=Flagellimonas abyssi TaxID=2864871 RepID=A0ABS7EW27_9FLAO|nr:hypothetical protein [Allomuricauda abyssi]